MPRQTVVEVTVASSLFHPPLRERRDGIGLLVSYFLGVGLSHPWAGVGRSCPDIAPQFRRQTDAAVEPR